MGYFGHVGSILHVDLSAGTTRREPLDKSLARRFIGGMGINTKILYDTVGPELDPFDTRAPLLISTGPLTGTLAPAGCRVEVTAKSPLTGMFGTANAGGFWGPVLKYAGYDAIVITGRAASSVYLWIDDDRVEIREATHIWGRDCWATTDLLRRELNESYPHEIRVMSIGPAGENLVRFASIQFDYTSSAARSGMGAVMGSKRLKAIAVRGTGSIAVADPRAFEEACVVQLERLRSDPDFDVVRQHGSGLGIAAMESREGVLPVKNYQAGTLPGWAETRSREIALEYARKAAKPHYHGIACHCCPLRCYSWIDINEGKYAGMRFSGLFLAMVKCWGAGCAVPDLPAVWKCEELCQRLGMDCVSSAGCISLAMELYQRGIIGEKELGGMRPDWGNDDVVVDLLHKIARREGLGDLLAEGTVRAAREIGGDAPHYAMAIKGLEIQNVDPRSYPGTAWWLGVMTNPRGGDNIKGTHLATFSTVKLKALAEKMGLGGEEFAAWFVDRLDIPPHVKAQIFGTPPRLESATLDGKAMMTRWYEDLAATMNSLGLCILDNVALVIKSGPTFYTQMLSTCVGEDVTSAELVKAGERAVNLQRLFLIRHGARREDDSFPRRFHTEMLPEDCRRRGPVNPADVNRLLDEYYGLRGWDVDGAPTKDTLERLGLDTELAENRRGG